MEMGEGRVFILKTGVCRAGQETQVTAALAVGQMLRCTRPETSGLAKFGQNDLTAVLQLCTQRCCATFTAPRPRDRTPRFRD